MLQFEADAVPSRLSVSLSWFSCGVNLGINEALWRIWLDIMQLAVFHVVWSVLSGIAEIYKCDKICIPMSLVLGGQKRLEFPEIRALTSGNWRNGALKSCSRGLRLQRNCFEEAILCAMIIGGAKWNITITTLQFKKCYLSFRESAAQSPFRYLTP